MQNVVSTNHVEFGMGRGESDWSAASQREGVLKRGIINSSLQDTLSLACCGPVAFTPPHPKFDVICAHYILHFLSRRLSTARRICSCLLVSVISRPSLNPLFGSCR